MQLVFKFGRFIFVLGTVAKMPDFYILSETRMLRNDYFHVFFKTIVCNSPPNRFLIDDDSLLWVIPIFINDIDALFLSEFIFTRIHISYLISSIHIFDLVWSIQISYLMSSIHLFIWCWVFKFLIHIFDLMSTIHISYLMLSIHIIYLMLSIHIFNLMLSIHIFDLVSSNHICYLMSSIHIFDLMSSIHIFDLMSSIYIFISCWESKNSSRC